MSNETLKAPIQCIEIGQSLLKVYGDSTNSYIENNIIALRTAWEVMPEEHPVSKLRIAQQIDFWSQVLGTLKQ